MAIDFSSFRDFYFMRCFSCEEYRNDFNSGRKAYINSVQYFHDLDDKFQQDFEGGIFRQPPNTKGYLLRSKANLTVDEVMDLARNNQLEDGELVAATSDFKFYINGYIFCLTIIPKCYIKFRENEIVFNSKHNISDAFWYLLNQYTQNGQYTYISLYDAETFMTEFHRQMEEKGYLINYGCVEYEDLSQSQRINYYLEKQISKLLFTKNERFNYQNEFQFFLQRPGQDQRDHIEETGIDMRCALVRDLVYLSPEYAKEKGLNNL